MDRPPLEALSDSALQAYLDHLDDEERQVSRRRRRLHDQIDFLAAGGFAHAESDAERLAELRRVEREISDERKAMHQWIDEVRAERSRRLNRFEVPAGNAAARFATSQPA